MGINNRIIICLSAVGVFRCFSVSCVTGVSVILLLFYLSFIKLMIQVKLLKFFKKNSISLYFLNIFVKKITDFIINFNMIRMNYNCILITKLFISYLQARVYASKYIKQTSLLV